MTAHWQTAQTRYLCALLTSTPSIALRWGQAGRPCQQLHSNSAIEFSNNSIDQLIADTGQSSYTSIDQRFDQSVQFDPRKDICSGSFRTSFQSDSCWMRPGPERVKHSSGDWQLKSNQLVSHRSLHSRTLHSHQVGGDNSLGSSCHRNG